VKKPARKARCARHTQNFSLLQEFKNSLDKFSLDCVIFHLICHFQTSTYHRAVRWCFHGDRQLNWLWPFHF